MNPRCCFVILALVCIHLTAIGTASADDTSAVKPEKKKPIAICIVSGEHLQPGEIVSYVYKEAGHPDRTLRFCCRKCLARFKADPEPYLKKLDQLEAKDQETPPDDR